MTEPNAFSQTLAIFAPIHKDGYKFVAVAAAATVLAFLLSSVLGLLAAFTTFALAFFFRDPARIVPIGDGLIVAPADGVVIGIESLTPPAELGLGSDPEMRVSIFLSILDVHVVRAPFSGNIVADSYKPGLHHNAASSAAVRENERHSFVIQAANSARLGLVLVAGTVARRIVANIKEGDGVMTGERIGIIRFGSRVDVYLPASAEILVGQGQRTIGGETVIADLSAREPIRTFRRV
ncbi:MAG TPA: phosphatidylserine decarboxylase [Hyphomicrobiales bacterium]|nr:phosphatidylserine decarboxylase [Hyphomicrobiales bacterium]